MVFLAVRWRLGLKLPRGLLVGRCACGSRAPDPYGRHAGSCGWGGGRQLHHDYLAVCLRLILTEAGAWPGRGEVFLRPLGVEAVGDTSSRCEGGDIAPANRETLGGGQQACVGKKSKMDVWTIGFSHYLTELYDIRISDATGSDTGVKPHDPEAVRKKWRASKTGNTKRQPA